MLISSIALFFENLLEIKALILEVSTNGSISPIVFLL